jgi:hypothetical protein
MISSIWSRMSGLTHLYFILLLAIFGFILNSDEVINYIIFIF